MSTSSTGGMVESADGRRGRGRGGLTGGFGIWRI